MSKQSNKFEQEQLNQINKLDEGLMSRFMKKILSRRFAKFMKAAYKYPATRDAYDAFYKSVDYNIDNYEINWLIYKINLPVKELNKELEGEEDGETEEN